MANCNGGDQAAELGGLLQQIRAASEAHGTSWLQAHMEEEAGRGSKQPSEANGWAAPGKRQRAPVKAPKKPAAKRGSKRDDLPPVAIPATAGPSRKANTTSDQTVHGESGQSSI